MRCCANYELSCRAPAVASLRSLRLLGGRRNLILVRYAASRRI